MATTRIRYSKTNQDGLLQSVQKFQHPTNGARYKVMLNLTESQWLIIDDVTDIPVATGHHKDQHKMKLAAKKALTGLGVAFQTEARKERSPKSNTQAA